jgi:hypothetical protein
MRIVSGPSGARLLLSAVTTRNPANPKIHVQSRRDPTGPPLLFAHQEKMTPDGPVHVGSRFAKYYVRTPWWWNYGDD